MNHVIELPKSLYDRLNKLSEGTRATPASIAKKAIQEHLDYEEWLLTEVDAGIADVEAGRVHSSDEVKKMLGVKNAKKR
jgi:predicted transcriptional regulator